MSTDFNHKHYSYYIYSIVTLYINWDLQLSVASPKAFALAARHCAVSSRVVRKFQFHWPKTPWQIGWRWAMSAAWLEMHEERKEKWKNSRWNSVILRNQACFKSYSWCLLMLISPSSLMGLRLSPAPSEHQPVWAHFWGSNSQFHGPNLSFDDAWSLASLRSLRCRGRGEASECASWQEDHQLQCPCWSWIKLKEKEDAAKYSNMSNHGWNIGYLKDIGECKHQRTSQTLACLYLKGPAKELLSCEVSFFSMLCCVLRWSTRKHCSGVPISGVWLCTFESGGGAGHIASLPMDGLWC